MFLASDYDYDLPRELIAQHPLANRSDARLLVVDRRSGELAHRYVRDLPSLLDPRDGLVVNDTRVVPARLVGYRTATGGRWEGLFLSADAQGNWLILCKTRGKLQPAESITIEDITGQHRIQFWLLERREGGVWLGHPQSEESPWTLLERVGRVPLPFYIRGGQMVSADVDRYQTVYAQVPGSAAAPTAGLHLTEELLSRLSETGISISQATLHVGIDTFRPLDVEHLEEHRMHSEWCSLDVSTVKQIEAVRARGGRVVAIGTTTTRVLESAAASGTLEPLSGQTNLFIRPPYQFRAVDVLLTNFHLPRSTLLVLVRTFGGDELLRHAYAEAVRERYRFYSYGDAMLIL